MCEEEGAVWPAWEPWRLLDPRRLLVFSSLRTTEALQLLWRQKQLQGGGGGGEVLQAQRSVAAEQQTLSVQPPELQLACS